MYVLVRCWGSVRDPLPEGVGLLPRDPRLQLPGPGIPQIYCPIHHIKISFYY